MSRENMDLVRQVYDAARRRDSTAVLALYDSDVELDNTRLVVSGGVYHGHDGLRAIFHQWNEAWESIDYEVEELIDAGDDHVVSVVSRHGRGRSSGVEVAIRVALVWTIRDGKVTRVVWFPTREDALEAAGIGG
jgi:ketosteroid isomerase-like protein